MFLFLLLFLFQARLRHAPRFRRLRLPPFPRLNVRPGLFPGLALAAILCLAGWQLARLPGLSLAGPMACTLLVAILYRQLLGCPEALRPGISFAGTKLLRAAIVLLGLKLPVETVLRQGLPLLAGAVATLAFALAASALLRRWLRADAELTMLLAIGTGICGAAAIAAAAPLLGAKEQKTAVGIGLIAAVGTVFALGDALLQPLLPLSGAEYGVWTGLTLHEIAHVAMASAAGGPDALETGMLAKLSRVLLLVPTVFALQALRARRARRELPAASAWRSLPWYLLGFLAMSLLASTGPGEWLPLPAGWEAEASRLTTLLLSVAMAALGLNVDARELRGALRPLAVLLLVSLLLSVLACLAIAL
ncbi:YeiH family protein [Cohnella fermenti]|uniref:Putative sulfate exporter family transporter n=1 Tax=Cohnella fermenti TaxID=2565925 RepID=A0A4S4CA47_9BACL|nr:putative sulfate exporter family transporter [Cohnella fermenti]THF84266.1 putative sulfate exporter family transporter [Cohnella fermenti]